MQERRHQASPVRKNRQQRLSSAGMTGDLLIQIRHENVQIGLVPARGQEGVNGDGRCCGAVSAVAFCSPVSGAMP